jgi:hypothetical protein
MNIFRNQRRKGSVNMMLPIVQDLGQAAHTICELALNDAKEQLHPLMRDKAPGYLRKRSEFTRAFKLALEQRVAHKLAIWQPGVQAVFRFDNAWMEDRNSWDGSIHLLVKVPHVSNTLRTLGRKLDLHLTHYLKQLGWSRFGKHKSILEIQQVTPNELRHGICYGAMFAAVYSVPVKVWPLQRTR